VTLIPTSIQAIALALVTMFAVLGTGLLALRMIGRRASVLAGLGLACVTAWSFLAFSFPGFHSVGQSFVAGTRAGLVGIAVMSLDRWWRARKASGGSEGV
jgi:hypothetical protein